MANISGGPSGPTPAPGWYPDPWAAGQARWWDGHTWTSATGAPPGAGAPGGQRPAPPGAPAPPPPLSPLVADPRRDLDDEQRAGRSASVGLIVGAAAYIGMFIAIAVVYHSFFHTFLDQIRDASRASANGRTGTSSTVTTKPFGGGTGMIAGSGVLQLAQLALLAVGVLFLVWVHRATQLAQAAGLQPRRTPGMAVAAFIIPIVNYWWPYQSVCDLFVPGDPRRRLVGRWWALWIVTQLFSISLFIASFGPAIVLAILVVIGSGVAVLAAMAARAVVAAVGDAHGEIVARATGSVVPNL